MRQPLERRKKMMEELSATLKALRKGFGFTQEQIAKVLGVDRSSYSYIETGKVMPSMEALLLFSKLYSLPVDKLLGRKEFVGRPVKERFALSKDEKTLLIYYRTSSAKQKKEILARIAALCGGRMEE